MTESETTDDDYVTDASESVEDDPIETSTNEEVVLLSPLKRKRSPGESILSHTNTLFLIPPCVCFRGIRITNSKDRQLVFFKILSRRPQNIMATTVNSCRLPSQL